MTTLNELFDQFVRERTYLNNVTPKTREWYLLSRRDNRGRSPRGTG